MKKDVMKLWKMSFNDSDDFIRFYFERIYREENTLMLKENGRPVSVLQMLPRQMTYCGNILSVAYICGVCTAPSERGKGRMRQLMELSVSEMQRRNYALAVLIPASGSLFNYYAQFDYATVFNQSVETYYFDGTDSNRHPNLRVVSSWKVSADKVFKYYDRKQRERPCAVLHSACDWENILLDCRMDGGDAWIALEGDKPVGMAVAVEGKQGCIRVRETVSEHPNIRKALLNTVLEHFQCRKAEVRISSSAQTGRPYGMARILDAARISNLYRSGGFQPDMSVPDDSDMQSLTQTLLFYNRRQAWMNLMLD
jgi:predicted acetyltransferase